MISINHMAYWITDKIINDVSTLLRSTATFIYRLFFLQQDLIGNFFLTTIGVRQGYILSPVSFNLFLERIMQITFQDHVPTISIGGRPICNLRFADDIDLMGGSNGELQASRKRWCIWYGSKFRNVEDHGQQHERHRCTHHNEWRKHSNKSTTSSTWGHLYPRTDPAQPRSAFVLRGPQHPWQASKRYGEATPALKPSTSCTTPWSCPPYSTTAKPGLLWPIPKRGYRLSRWNVWESYCASPT